MFESITRLFAKAPAPKSKGGSGPLPPVAPPKTKPKQQTFPGWITSTTISDNVIPKVDPQIANVDIASTYRLGNTTQEVLRNLARAHPDLAAAVSAYIRVGIPEKYIAIARDPDGTVNEDATRLAMAILERMDKLPGYDSGFSQTDSMRSVAEALAKEGILYGGMSLELVLDKGRLPYKFQPVSVTQVLFFNDNEGPSMGLKPVQNVGGTYIDLDLATFFMVHLDPSILDPYFQGPLEAAIQPVLGSATFLRDLRRVLNRHVYPRYDVSINEEQMMKSIPQEILLDEEKLPAHLNSILEGVKTAVNNLEPEEALLHFDWIEVKYIENSDGAGDASKFEIIKQIIDADLAKGAKVLPAVLGNGAGSQNIASTETMLFLLSANAMVRLKLQELFSKALTLAVRMFGLDVTVAFEYDEIELRPETELAIFRQMQQERLMTQLSFGMISDFEVVLRLTHRCPPAGYTPLSGTYFMTGGTPNGPLPTTGTQDQNSYSGTSSGGGQSGGGAANQSRKTGTPTSKKGPAK